MIWIIPFILFNLLFGTLSVFVLTIVLTIMFKQPLGLIKTNILKAVGVFLILFMVYLLCAYAMTSVFNLKQLIIFGEKCFEAG